MERWQFAVPPSFAPHLLPLVESAGQFAGDGDWRREVARHKLQTVVGHSPGSDTKEDRVEIADGELRWVGKPFRAERLVRWQHDRWLHDTAGKKAKERQELMPLHVKHGAQALTPLPKSARTRFPKASARQKEPRPAKRLVTLMRVTRIQLVCPDREFLDRLCQLLADAKCPAEADRRNLSLAYSKQHEPAVTNAVKTLGKEYQIKIEDAGAG